MTNHKINDAGLSLIKNFEGLRLKAYRCPAGKWTIGYGHTSGVGQGDTITEYLAEMFLLGDVTWAEAAMNRLNEEFIDLYGWDPVLKYGANGFSALVSFTFNLGTAWSHKSGLRTRLMAAEWREAADQLLRWDKARNPNTGKLVALKGLTRRRIAERKLFLTKDVIP